VVKWGKRKCPAPCGAGYFLNAGYNLKHFLNAGYNFKNRKTASFPQEAVF
jgi:hypothetical protein